METDNVIAFLVTAVGIAFFAGWVKGHAAGMRESKANRALGEQRREEERAERHRLQQRKDRIAAPAIALGHELKWSPSGGGARCRRCGWYLLAPPGSAVGQGLPLKEPCAGSAEAAAELLRPPPTVHPWTPAQRRERVRLGLDEPTAEERARGWVREPPKVAEPAPAGRCPKHEWSYARGMFGGAHCRCRNCGKTIGSNAKKCREAFATQSKSDDETSGS